MSASSTEIKILTALEQRETALTLARSHGFQLYGIVHVSEDGAPRAADFANWLARGYEGPLDYMRNSRELRSDVRKRIPWARSVLALGAFHDSAPRGERGRDLIAHV